MNIRHFKKENQNDCGCASVCLRMALDYFGIHKNITEVNNLCEALGDVHYSLPWGICLGAAKVGLYSTFISKNPWELLQSSREDIANMTNISIDEVKRIERNQVNRCKENELIKLLDWNDQFRNLPKRLVRGEKGIVIPTVWWGRQPHNIVLVNYMDPGIEGFESVYYHDPNGDDTLPTMPENEFFGKWLDPRTDNDLLVISRNKIEI